MITIDVGQYGANLLSRDRAARIREYIEEQIRDEDVVEFDCGGVVSVSPSFADECFGVLVARLAGDPRRPALRIVGAGHDVRAVLRFAISRRLDMAQATG